MNDNKTKQTIIKRKNVEQDRLLENLKKIPIIQVACERANVSRATYYRWRNENHEFQKSADEAIAEGEAFITDMSESQLISMIKDKHWAPIKFWLQHHHPKYGTKIELIAKTHETNELTSKQQKILECALKVITTDISQLSVPVFNEEYKESDNSNQ